MGDHIILSKVMPYFLVFRPKDKDCQATYNLNPTLINHMGQAAIPQNPEQTTSLEQTQEFAKELTRFNTKFQNDES